VVRVRPVEVPEFFCLGARPACLTQRPAGSEPSRVAGLGQDGCGADSGQASDRGGQFGQAQLAQDGDHPLLGAGQAGLGVAPVGQQQRDALQRAGPQRGHPGRIGAGIEDSADDLPPRVDRVPAGDLAAHRGVEPPPAQPAHPAQIAAVRAG
jgi:hypothetical protein